MMRSSAVSAILASLILLAPHPAWADGGASTRNIILGGAAAAGTLIIINHNKQVHERYAEDARRQAALQAERNDAQAAYASERSAYDHQVAINQELQKEVTLQHQAVLRLERELADAKKRATAQAANAVSYGWGQI
jgi:hypothetical protein